MKKITLLICCFSVLLTTGLYAQNATKAQDETTSYNPHYWLASFNPNKNNGQEPIISLSQRVNNIYAKGWRGIMYWGAGHKGAVMDYYFKSPFLEQQKWAVHKEDNLDSLVIVAHKKNMGVMVDIEEVSPYDWPQNHWTAESIRKVADDLAATGIDAVFEENFEVKPELFLSLAGELKKKKVDYISGIDPMLLREPIFSSLWPGTSLINIYNYYLKRDKIFSIATLAEDGSLGYGWAKYWGKPTSLMSPLDRNWGIDTAYSPAVVSYLCMIRALQFRVDNIVIFGGMDSFDPMVNGKWIKEYVDKQRNERPLMDIVVLLKNNFHNSQKDPDASTPEWNRLFNSGDAITSGAFNAGYNVIVSDKVVPADAYWIYAPGGSGDELPSDVVNLFNTNKPVFIQCGSGIPSGNISFSWKTVLQKCGVDGTKSFSYGGGAKGFSGASLPPSQEEEIPYTGYYKNNYLRFTGSDIQHGEDLRAGTIIPKEAINGTVYCRPNDTYGKGPYIIGKNKKYVVTATALNWEVNYPISNLLSGGGILPSSNVWGIAGKDVTALLAIETTDLNITIPGLSDGSKIHVVVWDDKKNKQYDETVTYNAPYKHMLNAYDFILINRVR